MTIIDALCVQLKLDSKPLDQAAPAAGKRLKDLEGQSTKTSDGVKKIGETSKQSASGVDTLAKAVGSFLALIGGTVAIKAFVSDMISSSAALDRFSKNLGLSASDVTAWGNATEELGGSAKGLQSTLSLLSKAQTDLTITGDSQLLPYFSMMGVSLATAGGQARKTTDILADMADYASGKNRTTMHNMFASMGFDEGTINLLLLGRKELELSLKRQKEYGDQVAKFAPEATKLQRSLVDLKQQFTLIGLSLLQQAAPAIEKVLGVLSSLGNWVHNNLEFIKDLGMVLGAIGVGLTAISIAASPITLTVAAVVALASAIALLWQDYSEWKRGGDTLIDWEKWKPGIDAAKAAIRDLAKYIKEYFGAIFEDVNAVQKLMKGDWKGALGSARKSDDHVRAALGAGVNAVTTIAKAVPATGKAFGLANGQSVSSAYAMKYFQDRGMSAAEAAGLASQIHSESSGKANSVGDHGAAYGLIQWHADRQANFKKMFGHDIRNSTVDEQLAFMVHELQTTERSAGNKLRASTSAGQAGEIASKYYVRPADVTGEASRRGAYARMLSGIGGASSTVAQAGGTPGGSSSASSDNSTTVTANIAAVNIQTQATDANGIARAFSRGMNPIFTSYANSGMN